MVFRTEIAADKTVCHDKRPLALFLLAIKDCKAGVTFREPVPYCFKHPINQCRAKLGETLFRIVSFSVVDNPLWSSPEFYSFHAPASIALEIFSASSLRKELKGFSLSLPDMVDAG